MKAVRSEPFKTKYQVFNITTRKFVPDCFILFPASDPAAIPALKVYLAALPGDDSDRQTLEQWIAHLESVHKEWREMEKY